MRRVWSVLAFCMVALVACGGDTAKAQPVDEATARTEFADRGEEYGPDGITSRTIEELRQVEPYIWCARITVKHRQYDFQPWRPLLDNWYCRDMYLEPALEDGVYSSNVPDVVLDRLRREGKVPQ